MYSSVTPLLWFGILDHAEHLSDGINRRIEALARRSDDLFRHLEAISDGRKLLLSAGVSLLSGAEYLRSGAAMLRSAGFFHLLIKPENIRVDQQEQGSNQVQLSAKLIRICSEVQGGWCRLIFETLEV
jgi:hypothetical protein